MTLMMISSDLKQDLLQPVGDSWTC